VGEQRKAKEAAAKAETDLKDLLTSLQVGLEVDCFCRCDCGQEVITCYKSSAGPIARMQQPRRRQTRTTY
jgi:hypothetical protein